MSEPRETALQQEMRLWREGEADRERAAAEYCRETEERTAQEKAARVARVSPGAKVIAEWMIPEPVADTSKAQREQDVDDFFHGRAG